MRYGAAIAATAGVALVTETMASAMFAGALSFGIGDFRLEEIDSLSTTEFLTAIPRYLWYYPTSPSVQWWAMLSGSVAFSVVAVTAAGIAYAMFLRRRRVLPLYTTGGRVPEPQRARSRLHGHSRWLTVREASKVFGKVNPALGGIPVGELNRADQDTSIRNVPYVSKNRRTWGRGGRSPVMLDPMVPGRIASGIIFSGSGGGKTSGFTIPALHSYKAAMVINDPSGEASAITADYRRDIGQRVSIIDAEFPALGAMNILKSIDCTNQLAPMQIEALVAEASGPSKPDATKEEEFFKATGIQLNTVLLADLLFDPNAPHTVREWRKRIVTPEKEMRKRLASIYAKSKSDYARDVAGTMMGIVDETFSGVCAHATRDTSWLSIRPLADLLSEETFDPADLTTGRRTVYMQFPSQETNPSIARVVLGSLMRSVLKAKGRVYANVPFIIDEVYQLKYMNTLAVVRDEGRRSGMPIFTCWQSQGQMDEIWGAGGKKAWFSSAAWRMYIGSVSDPQTREDLSKECGSYTVIAPSQNSPQSGFSANGSRGASTGQTFQPQRLISEDDLRTGIRADEAIVLLNGRHPARLGTPRWYRRPEMVEDFNPNPFLPDEKVAA